MRQHFCSGARSEAGETLIEVLIASALMGIVVVTVIGGITTMLLGAMTHRAQASANSVLVSAVERVKSADTIRARCAQEADYLAAAQTATLPQEWLDRGWTGAKAFPTGSISMAYETGNPADQSLGGTFFFKESACPDTGTPTNTLTLQLIKISVTDPGGRVTQSLSFIKGGS
jgi:Tfp pilus assembly protein PilV